MEKLYLGSYIKTDKLANALHYAKINGRLIGVDDVAVRDFLADFEKVRLQRHAEFQSRIDHREMEKIISLIGMNHSDHVSDKQLQTLSTILLNEDFQF